MYINSLLLNIEIDSELRVIQIPSMSKYLLSIYVESILKFFKNFDSLGAWSLDVGLIDC